MNSIGGFFELELRHGEEYHKDAYRFNTGRNALEVILLEKSFSKVYIPYFSCNAILEPFIKHNIKYEYYKIDLNLEPVFNFNQTKENEAFIYTNYFGLKDKFISSLKTYSCCLIIDNSQSFFSKPISGVSSFYSCRKFLGVPDGAYLYFDNIQLDNYPIDHSEHRFSHLLKRIEYGSEEAYRDFIFNESNLKMQPIKQMSKLTRALLRNIDYEFIINKRKENFAYLHKKLKKYNHLNIDNFLCEESVPLVYPFMTSNQTLRRELFDYRIYTAVYWPEILEKSNKKSVEYTLASKIVNLNIDQRLDKEDLDYQLEKIKL